MSDNPYAPPKTHVVDSDPALVPMERPKEIMTAIWLAFIGYGLGIVVVLLTWDYYSKLQTLGGFLGSQLFTLAIMFWLYYKIYMGRNWARIVLLVLAVIGLAVTMNAAAMSLLKTAPMLAKAQMGLGLVLNIVVLWLLFLSPGRHWFRRTPLRN